MDECTVENGCLLLYPGVPKMKRVGRHVDTNQNEMLLEKALHPSEFQESRSRDLLLQAGQMALFDVFLVHGSNANRSPQRRQHWYFASCRRRHTLTASLASRSVRRYVPPIWGLGRFSCCGVSIAVV
ncbi:MAG: hypothetical protein CM1200mP41_36540 [Gammaproteobacteria bacterium]|nr:MAG: hypothetical protein CM1200mP41_36540 [Gammaproteobacteria bacterium]